MKNSKKFILFVLTSSFIFACSDVASKPKKSVIQLSNYEKLKKYCLNFKVNVSDFKNIVVINEIGTCLNCNNIFSRSQSKNLNSDSTLFIVSGAGGRVDFSAYINNHSKNLIFDEFADFDTLDIVRSCAILTIAKNKIHSIEEINIKTVSSLSSRTY